MKNIHLIIFLLILIIIAVIGLNMKYKKVFYTDSVTQQTCMNWIKSGENTVLKNHLQNIEATDALRNANEAVRDILANMYVNKVQQFDENGNPISYYTNPCIFPKEKHEIYRVNNVTCRDLGFSASNASGDCLHELVTLSNFTTLNHISSNIYNYKTRTSQQQAQSLLAQSNIAFNSLNIATNENTNLLSDSSSAQAANNVAQSQNSTLTASNMNLQNQQTQAAQQGANLNAQVTQGTNRVDTLNLTSTSLYQVGFTSSSLLSSKLKDGHLIRRWFFLQGDLIRNEQQMNAQFNNTKSDRDLSFVNNFTVPNTDFIALEYCGFIKVPTSGQYTFGLTSDDASDFAVYTSQNRWVIVTHAYGYKPVEGSPPNPGIITLNEGAYYPIRIRFHEHGGDQSINLFWKQPGQGQQHWTTVPFSVFSCNNGTWVTHDLIRENGYPDPRVA